MQIRSLLLALVGVAALPLAAGCDSGAPAAVRLDANTYTIRVGDGPSQTHTLAVYGTGTVEGRQAFGLVLGNDSMGDTTFTSPFLLFSGIDTRLPARGRYDLTNVASLPAPGGELPSAVVIGAYLVPGAEGEFPTFYVSEGGALEVTESGADEIAGRYTLRARAVDLVEGTPSGPRVTITGEFRARRDDALFQEGPALRLPAPPAAR